MYQLGLTPASTIETPRMSLALGANRWASKVVVVLQLAAWTAVGIVLLQKGVAALQKNSAAVNSSLINKPSYNDSVANLLMKELRPEDEVEEEVEEFAELDQANSTTTEKYAGAFEVTRGLRPPLAANVGGGTAAAAVAMVAVGAVMLVLGPAVIILRALDERRQERRFLKLSAQDDLPPSYEQATLMDEAPRYSTLSLNTIINCATAGGQTSSTVAIVNSISNDDENADSQA